jgi:hypothetical protein
MISLDWVERIKKDTVDFFESKLPKKDYDIDIVYNAYPMRIDNKIPHAVITLVAKTLASKMAKTADKYLDFYDYIIEHKGENGKIIFANIMAKAVKKNPDFFLPYLEKILINLHDQRECNLVIDKALFPLAKKDSAKYLDLLIKWVKTDNSELMQSIQKVLIKLIHFDPKLARVMYLKLETSWLYATPDMIKLNARLIKEMYKFDKKLYFEIFAGYKNTRNPVFADILCKSICCYDKKIEEITENWTHSGNIKLKKIGLHAAKMLKKFRK